MSPKNTVLMYHSKFPKKSVMEDTEADTEVDMEDMEVDMEVDMEDVEVSEVSEVDLEEDLEENKYMMWYEFSIQKNSAHRHDHSIPGHFSKSQPNAKKKKYLY